MERFTYLFFLILSGVLNAYAQADSSIYQMERLNCNGVYLEFKLPESFRRVRSQYTEGTYFVYTAPDSSELVIHCGFNVVLPLLHERKYKIAGQTDRGRTGMQRKTDFHWREKNLNGGINIYYVNVRSSKRDYFDNLLDDIIKQNQNARE